MEFSLFGNRLSKDAGILELMDDLGRALEGSQEMIMLGGGNPASIPAMSQVWRRRLDEILSREGELDWHLAQYDAPGGRAAFKKVTAEFLKRNYGWDVGPGNIVVTGGSQSAFFLLFNLLSGEFSGGRSKSIFFPLAPEYIGYADQALAPGQFVSRRPRIVEEAFPFFKYHVAFSEGFVPANAGALCAGRPTNPTGNLLTDLEVQRLASLARVAGVPFLLDNAYGAPFPSIVFSDIQPFWDSNTVVSLSLSKLGLPSVRTGILVASESIVGAVASANAIVNLTNPGLGQGILQPLLDDDSLLDLCHDIIRPYYLQKRNFAIEVACRVFADPSLWRVHLPEGSLFLWFWFPQLAIGSKELYQRLKGRGVLVVPGDAFFFGLPEADQDWQHRRQCVRVNYARPSHEIEQGLLILAQEVSQASIA